MDSRYNDKNQGVSNQSRTVLNPGTEEIEAKIQSLTKELEELKYQLANCNGNGNGDRCISAKQVKLPAVQLDAELQNQVLLLTEKMPHMVWIADSEGRTTHANSRFFEFSGLDLDSDDGWAWVKVLHKEDLARAVEKGNEAAKKNQSFSMEVRCKSKDGNYKWHLMHSIPFYDPSSNSTKWFGTTTSIHDQKLAQEKLLHSEHRFRTLADAIPHVVFVANPSGSIHLWNHRFIEYSGFTKEQCKTDAWQLLIHEQDRVNYLEQWQSAISSGDTFEFEFRLKRGMNRNSNSQNRYLWHLARAVSLRNANNQVEQWFGTWTDIDEQKRSNDSTR